jgi:hypothetical protein
MASTCERATGQHGGGGLGGSGGGGHGSGNGHGFGGHSGHSSAASSSAHSSGHSIGHSIGHSFARIFGHHSQGASSLASAEASAKSWSVTPANSVPGVLHHRPVNSFPFRTRLGLVSRRRPFGFAGCDDGWFDYRFRFANDWNCPNNTLFFDPFFFGWSSGPLLFGPAFGGTTWFDGSNSDATNEMTYTSEGSDASMSKDAKAARPITLLQLRDGTMCGLTDYWLQDGELHYTTTYGGQGSVPFERIDLEKTAQVNTDRGVQFTLPAPPR